MKIKYDEEADAAYIRVKNGEVAKTKEIDEHTNLDLDKEGNIIGIELLFVKERMPELLKEIKKEKIAC